MNLSYELINKNNINLASSIQGTIFPGESAIQHYKLSIRTNYKNSKYYIIKSNNIPVGITGIYTRTLYDKHINDTSVWLGWFGILPEFRSKGIGRQALLDTIEKAKAYNKKYFRIYTVSTDNAIAQPLYKSIMHYCEPYQNDEDYNYYGNCYIYTYNLKNNNTIEPWNNLNLYINEDIKMGTISNKEQKEYYKIFITTSSEPKNFDKIISLATTIRTDGHLVDIGIKPNPKEKYNIIINQNITDKQDIYNQIKENKKWNKSTTN